VGKSCDAALEVLVSASQDMRNALTGDQASVLGGLDLPQFGGLKPCCW
jgi:hypothetical protein